MNKVLVLDFGSQYTQLIARKLRELSVYSELQPYNIELEKIKEFDPSAIILSGGPASIYSKNAPRISDEIFDLNIPILGICYGMQLIAKMKDGEVVSKSHSQYGNASVHTDNTETLFQNCHQDISVWMSHGDSITKLPKGFKSIAHTHTSSSEIIAAFENLDKKIWGIQFHPEVYHTTDGKQILTNFLKLSNVKCDFKMESFAKTRIKEIKDKVGNEKVICALSGGVDSTVAATLIHNAIGDNLTCIFVNNGLLRKNEAEDVLSAYKKMLLNVKYVDASEIFLEHLKNVIDPEEKRKIVGRTFIEVFEKEKNKLGKIQFLAQGTTYPDVIESISFKGPSSTIKSHHNVGGLPEKMNLKLIEPLRELFKDEVRLLGRELEVPENFIKRHPFPGPGLAVRILGTVTPEKISTLQDADAIAIEEITMAGLYDDIWQLGTIFLPVKTVGVKGDERSYENAVAIRAVRSIDGMTADWADIPHNILKRISTRIINEVQGINRVVYDISTKPPATIEWE